MPLAPLFLGGFLILGGIQHFVYADFVTKLVPAWIPGARFWVYVAARLRRSIRGRRRRKYRGTNLRCGAWIGSSSIESKRRFPLIAQWRHQQNLYIYSSAGG